MTGLISRYKLEIKKAWAINVNPRFFSQYSGKTMIAGFHTLNIIHAGLNISHHFPFNTSTKGLPTEPEGGLISRQVAIVAAISYGVTGREIRWEGMP